MVLIAQLMLITMALFSYFIHLLLMHRFVGQRPIVTSFKTHFFTIMFIYFGIKWVQVASPVLFLSAPANEVSLFFDELYFGLAIALAILVTFNAVSAEAFTEFTGFLKQKVLKHEKS
jgi:hypothetical protein